MVDFSVLFVVWSGKFCTFKHQETVQVNTYKKKLIKAHFDTDIKQLSLTFNILLCRSNAMK